MFFPKVSQSFETQDLSAKAKYYTTGGLLENPTSEPLEVGFSYDQETERYTISIDGRVQVFGPSDIDLSLSNDAIVVFAKDDGTTVETLTLTKAGTSGPLTYQYVGGGVWERAVLKPASIDGNLDVFTYGFETPNAALPEAGNASYSIDVIGTRTTGFGVDGLVGTGSFDVDFARGTFAMRGTMSGVAIPVFEFVGDGRLAAAENGYSGQIRFFEPGTYHVGALRGMFYGPSAQELGAVWEASPSGISGLDLLYTGIILGREEAVLSNPTSFADLSSSAFLDGGGYRLDRVEDGPISDSEAPLSIHYDADSEVYTVYDPDRSYYLGYDYSSVHEADAASGDLPTLEGLVILPTPALSYVASGQWLSRQTKGGTTTRRYESFHFGFPTAPLNVPTSGSGLYETETDAWLIGDGIISQPLDLQGEGILLADFASGAISLTGDLIPMGFLGGAYKGSGTISSSAKNFGGAISVNLYGYGDLTGSFSGTFYGPSAEEVGASFQASGAGSSIVATLVGANKGAIPPGSKPLADYTNSLDATNLYDVGFTVRGSSDFALNRLQGDVSMIWNPSDDSYLYTFTPSAGSPDKPADVTFSEVNKDPVASDDKFDVYSVADASSNQTARVYKTNNPEVALTYTSFFEYHRVSSSLPGGDADNDLYYFGLLGTPTPTHQMPRFGTATYSGFAYGTGVTTTTSSPISKALWDIEGTSALQINFQTSEALGSVSLAGVDRDDNIRDFGTFDLEGHVSSDAILNLTDPGRRNTLLGHFFGPDADEFAAVFDFQAGDSTETTYLVGATVGAKD